MKKFFALLTIFSIVITCLTACSASSDQSKSEIETTITTETTEISEDSEEFSYEAADLVTSYCSHAWDGSFIHNNKHCASIIDGELWIDCKIVESIPDMGPYEDCFWLSVVGTSDSGTWVFDRNLGTVELWQKGTRYKKIVTSFKEDFLTDVYFLGNCLVARNNSNISIYSLDGYNITNISEVIDCYKKNDVSLLISNFKHENFEINTKGEPKKLSSNYVRFPRKNVKLEEDMSNLLTLPFNNYWSNNFEIGNLYHSSENFYYIDFYGNIIVNNKLVGNVNTGISNKINMDGPNLLTSANTTYYLNGKNLLIYQKGICTTIDIPDGEAKFEWHDERYGTVILIYGSSANDNTLIIVKDNKVKVIKEVSDANVAYKSGNKVYSLEWQEVDAEPKLFFEGAYAVSQRTDELEGAIVPSDKNNMEEYGESNLYSPYGIDK